MFTDHAIGCVKRFAGKKTPFFMHVCYTAPHYPLHAFPEDIAKYDDRWKVLCRVCHTRMIELGLMDLKWRLLDSDSKVNLTPTPWPSGDDGEESNFLSVCWYGGQSCTPTVDG